MKAEEKKLFEKVKLELAKKEGYSTWIDMYYKLNDTSLLLMYEKVTIEYANQLNELNEQVIENLMNKLKKVNPNEFSIHKDSNKRSDLEGLIFINIPSKYVKDNNEVNKITAKLADDILDQFTLTYKSKL